MLGVQTIPALDFPVQAFVVGTALGMAAALIDYAVSGDLERWPLVVACFAVPAFLIAALFAAVAAVT